METRRINGNLVSKTSEEWKLEDEKKIIPYNIKRLEKLPSIGDQLDMIYWDKVNGTNYWQDMITDVKETCPKDDV